MDIRPASPPTHPAEALIDTLFSALAAKDPAAALAVFDDRSVYTNVGLSTLRGRRKMRTVVRLLTGPAVDFRVYTRTSAVVAGAGGEVPADSPVTVLNERVDEIALGRLAIRFWVCGRFVVDDAVITEWRDYFDMVDIVKGFGRALLGVAVPRWNRPAPH